jgi:site-specific recombinase XerC
VTISIEKQLAIPRRGEEPQRVALKTKNSRRTFTMGKEVQDMLYARKVAAFPRIKGDDFVFATQAGRPFDQRNVCEDIRQAGNRAGLNPEGVQPVSAHDLRHSFATRYYRATKDIRRVAAWIGDTEVTCLRVYVLADATQNDERLWAEAI